MLPALSTGAMATHCPIPLYLSCLARLAVVLYLADSARSTGGSELSQTVMGTRGLSHLSTDTPVSPHLLRNKLLHRYHLPPPVLPTNRSGVEAGGPAEAMASLLEYAVPEVNLYLLYDYSHGGVDDFLSGHQGGGRSTTVLRYSDDLTPLQEVLTRPPTYTGTMHFLLLCSIKHTQRVFQYVREHNLESARVWWLAVVATDAWHPLQHLLREGTQVTLAVRTSLTTYRLVTSIVASDGLTRFIPAGTWVFNPNGPVVRRLMLPIVPDHYKLYENLGGRELLVAANDNLPFIGLKTLADGRLMADSGIDVEILNALSQFLNFTYRVVSPPDGQWGGPLPDGTVSGMIGMVARREVHLAICEITITGSRETVVDFTRPYYLESVALVTRAPAERNRAFAVFSPFSRQVWLCIAVFTLVMGPVLNALTRLMTCYVTTSPHRKTHEYSFNVFRSLVVQSNLIISPHWPLRFVFFSWYLFCFYIYALYAGTLTAVLALPEFEQPIDTLADLPEAADEGFTLGVVRDSSIEFIFKDAQAGIYKEVWSLFNHEDRSQSFFKYPDIGFEKITEEKFVFLNPQLSSELRATQRGRENYHFARETFYPQRYGVACNKGAPFLPKLNQMLSRMTEAGLIMQWKAQEIMKASEDSPRSDSKRNRNPSAITLKHLQAAFFVLVLGFLLAAVMLGMEVITIKLW